MSPAGKEGFVEKWQKQLEKVDLNRTEANLRLRVKQLEEHLTFSQSQDYLRGERFRKMEMIDKYVVALLPVLAPLYADKWELGREAFKIAEIVSSVRAGFVEGV
jgi:hypothetical protein